MAQHEKGLYRLLNAPAVYSLVGKLVGPAKTRRNFAANHIRAKAGDRILDIGCGPAHILDYLPQVTYVGYEPNPRYVESARLKHPHATFHAKIFEAEDARQHEPFDIAIISAVLHHLDDEEARKLFVLLKSVLKPGGRVVTLDNVFVSGQNPIARFLISIDRGRNVRTPEGYKGLMAGLFDNIEGVLLHKQFPPYTYWIMTGR